MCVPPAFIAGKSLIEFGPGSGHNALYPCSLHPSRYVAVDANPTGVAGMRSLFAGFPEFTQPEIVESLIEEFHTDERFDLVIVEGVIPQQNDPVAFLRHIAGFARPGGILMVALFDAASALADMMRRLLNLRLPRHLSVAERLSALRPAIEPHTSTLRGMSRPLDDFILDNIIQPMVGPLFSIVEAVPVLADEFDVYGCSPSFVVDWRWYKDLVGDDRRFNERMVDAYYRNLGNFVDYRVELPPHSREEGEELLRDCTAFYDKMREAQESLSALTEAISALEAVGTKLQTLSPRAGRSVREFVSHLTEGAALDDCYTFWGRGQQYVSFVRR